MIDSSSSDMEFGPPPYRISHIRCWPNRGEPSDELVVDRHGNIRHEGPSGSLDQWKGPTISGQGAFLLPGFVDPHVHVRTSASARASVDISDMKRTEDILRVIASRAPTGDGWISVWGLQPELLSGSPLTATALDQVSRGRPVRIRHRSAHAWVFNSVALQRLGIADLEASGGVVVERAEREQPTGHVVDHTGRVRDFIGEVTPRHELARHVRAWSRELAKEGVVAIVDATASNRQPELEQLADWAADDTVVQRVAAMSAVDITAAPRPVRFVGHKLMPPFPDDLSAVLAESWAQDIPVAVHCVTVWELANIIEAVEAIPPQDRGKLRIEHASQTPEFWIERTGQLGAGIVTHPAFIHAHGDRYLADPELAPHRWLYRVRSWKDAGVPLAFASDAPAGPASPLLQIHAATHRQTRSGAVLGESEAVDLEVAVAATTSHAATLGGLANDGFGTLVVGGPAHAVLIQPGPTGLDDPGSHVVATLIHGRVVE